MRLILILLILAFSFAIAKAAPKSESMQQILSNSITNFAVSLTQNLHHVAKEEENLILSPSNIYFTLSMLHLGSGGATRNQIAQTLGMPADDGQVTQIHQTIKEILQSIQYKDEYTQNKINIANGLFLKKGLDVKSSYAIDSQKYYDSQATTLDFEKDGLAAIKTINEWCSHQTDGRIPKIFDEPLDPTTLAVLASALYFNGRWNNEFSKFKTKTEKFNTGVRMIDVEMMNTKQDVRYINDTESKFEAIALDYAGLNFSMGIFLPYAGESLMTFTHNLKAEHLQRLFSADYRYVDYKIPRMKFSYSISLQNALTSLGLGSIFNKVDLSNMINNAPNNVKVGDAKHAAEIEVDEEGTKASAITVALFMPTSAMVYLGKSILFHVDRPFLIAIQHIPTKTIIFTGTVHKPVQSTV